MTTTLEQIASPEGTSDEQSLRALQQLFAAAQPSAVYSEPITSGNYTVITAREVTLGGGFGFGRGFGPAAAGTAATSDETSQNRAVAGGTGAGGGGGSNSRPVAVVVIGPDGVRVKPVVDITKIILAGIIASRALMAIVEKMRRARKG